MRFLYWLLAMTHTRECATAMHALDEALFHLIDITSTFLDEKTQNEISQLVKKTMYDEALTRLTSYLASFVDDCQHLVPLLEESWTLMQRYNELYFESYEKRYEIDCSQGKGESPEARLCYSLLTDLKSRIETCKRAKQQLLQYRRSIEKTKRDEMSSVPKGRCLVVEQRLKAKLD